MRGSGQGLIGNIRLELSALVLLLCLIDGLLDGGTKDPVGMILSGLTEDFCNISYMKPLGFVVSDRIIFLNPVFGP